MIGIIASMDEELEFFKKNLSDIKIDKDKFHTFISGRYSNKDFVLAKCLTGKVNMAVTAQKLIDRFHNINLLINIGVAGGIGENIKIGEVVIATSSIQHDMDATGLGYKIGEIPDINIKEFKADKNFISASKKINKKFSFSYRYGIILTGDILVESKELCKKLINTYGGECVDMETAALAQVAFINNIPYAGIRGISDNSDENATKNFRNNLKKASDNACEFLLNTINHI